MKNQAIHSSITLALVALLASACQSSSTTHERPDNAAWAAQANEALQSIPAIAVDAPAPLATLSEPELSAKQWPWGAPHNLTRPLGAAKASPAAAPAKPSKEPAGSGEASRPVVVNVTHNAGPAAEAAPSSQATPPASRLEQLYSGQFERAANRRLEQFGYAYFEKLGPSNGQAGPVPDSYPVGPGDELILSLSGGVEAVHKLLVDRDGYIAVPEFGNIPVANLAFSDLAGHLLSFLKERRVGFDLNVSMGRLRVIRVNVIGHVARPGIVEVPALSSPLQALAAAGGPLKSGTLRQISLRQPSNADAPATAIDLYRFLRAGGADAAQLHLREGDTLHVPAIGTTVGVAGYVQQPAIYELSQAQTTVAEALELAGGLTPFSFTPLAHIERTIEGRGRQRIGVELNQQGAQLPMRDGELLLVEAVDNKRQPIVRIEGEVSRPGDYEFRPGMTLSELIAQADGLTIEAYLPQAFVSRQLGETQSIEDIPNRSSHQRSRRVLVADLAKALGQDPDHDIELMPLDLVSIRSLEDSQPRPVVEVIGSVQRPGVYELTAGMRISDLVAIAGNPTPEVYYDEAELIRKVFDEQTRRLDVRRYRFNLRQALSAPALESRQNPLLANGDRLVIRALQTAHVRVRVEGQVRFPGEYVFQAGAKISDLVAAAGGILAEADLRAAAFHRVSTKKLQEQRLDHLEERTRRLFETALERMAQTGYAREGLAAKLSLQQSMNTLDRIKGQEADGRIVIPFNRPDFPSTRYNLPLEEGDRLLIPQRHATISVAGHVFQPISLVAGEPISIEQALERAGGLTESADREQLYVIRADGSVDSVAQKASRLRKTDPLLPGDVLLAPQKAMERTLNAKLGDALLLARSAAELGLIGAAIGEDIDFTLVQPSSSDKYSTSGDILLDQVK